MRQLIGIFSSNYKKTRNGGTEKFTSELIKWFSENNFFPILICLEEENQQETFPDYQIITVKDKSFAYSQYYDRKEKLGRISKLVYHLKRFRNHQLAQKVTQLFFESGVKHVLLQDLSIASYLLPKYLNETGIAVTAFCHSYEWIMPSHFLKHEKHNPFLIFLWQWQARSARTYIKRYVANSEFMRTCLYQVLGKNISCEILLPLLNLTIKNSQRRLDREAEEIVNCVYSGTIVEHKGIIQFLEQVAKLGITWLHINIYGDGPLRSVLEKYINERVTWHGYVDQQRMKEVFTQADFTIVPSLWDEAFGRVAIESIASGCPVLAARRGGLIEQARILPGVLLYEPDDLYSLESQLKSMKEVIAQGIAPENILKELEIQNNKILKKIVADLSP
jgi:glycosyltransferase involved in cell wall biosynthesis